VKYAVISDLHANAEALSAVLACIERDGVDEILCLGDIVGYAASPNECVRLLRATGARSIAGNHDRAAAGVKDLVDFGERARRAIAWTRTHLTEDNLEFLRGLPSTLLTEERLFLVHGALHPAPNDDLHLSTPARVARSLAELATGRFGAKLCFFGHTHRPAVYSYRGGRAHPLQGPTHVLADDAHYLVNPGSVGESRDGDVRAAYALFDTRERRLELRRIEYDVSSAERRRRAHGLADAPAVSRSNSWLRRILGSIVRG
jgi:predicted phosphodiesterase